MPIHILCHPSLSYTSSFWFCFSLYHWDLHLDSTLSFMTAPSMVGAHFLFRLMTASPKSSLNHRRPLHYALHRNEVKRWKEFDGRNYELLYMTATLVQICATSVVSIENVLQCIAAYIVIAWLGSSSSYPACIESMYVQHSCDRLWLHTSPYGHLSIIVMALEYLGIEYLVSGVTWRCTPCVILSMCRRCAGSI